jgi:hypothetical protein
LNCSSNQIAELPALPASLTSLSGHENRLPALPTLPPKLQYMDVHNNRIAALPSLPASLQWFVCSGNQIEALPALPASLRYLDGSGNRLTALPTLPGGLADLYCHNNNLASLPALPEGLTGLDCFSNRLTALPALPASLKWLNGYDNRLAMLPALPDGLEYLSCHNNQLTALPSLPKALKELDCFDNQLAALPELPAGLQQLYCAGNRLAALPGLPETLQLLSCADNRLTGIALNGYANYTYIDVRYNYLPDQSHVTGAPISWNTGSFYFSPQLPPGFKAVAAIEGVPATAIAHVPLTLSAKVSPTDATNRTIVWSITDAGTTGAKLSGNVFTATATGRATLLASIANGESPDGRPYQQSFAIAVATGPVKEVELQLLSETTLRIHNTGNVETGTLRLTLTGTRSEAFALAPSNPGSLPAGGETIVTISAVADLPPLSYALRLTVEADNMKPVAIDIALRIVPDSAESVEPQALRVAAAEGGLHISGLIPGKRFLVYNLRGELISNETARAAGQMLPLPMRGLYILVHEGQSLKAVY